MSLSTSTRQAILNLQKQYPEKRSALIPALHLAQHEQGYLSEETQKEVALLFDLAPSEVHAVVSFYDMFFEKPVGKHLLHVCKNVSCMLRGGDQLLATLCEKLKVSPGERTEDGEFTVIASECLGACDRAPMLLADDQVVGPVALSDLDALLRETQAGPGHPCPAETTEEAHA